LRTKMVVFHCVQILPAVNLQPLACFHCLTGKAQ
jgi:hypothetical protein